ncbi:MAG: TetR family transcriptional regulator [Novosphingobium sp. 32-60-15]|uniref:TetR/AcrR family transcriptional regulator n=1 Tax=unclassified Novosphingobium TaxID=2644732 RepID=UPI000BD49A2D|nr:MULTISPECIES: TetR/AcrR family transcriptional regulator [unclassified Novosphingobium]OYX63828.1 MAG: TetR family transcriptional regulator [Novosphingobium sp. 32-60-15]
MVSDIPIVKSPFKSQQERRDEREAKRMAVLTAAVKMFNARGYHATSLDDVAASLGVSKPTIYHYLGNKERVLVECLTFGMDQLLTAAADARAGLGRGIDRLRAFLISYAEVNMEDFGRCNILTANETLSPDARETIRLLKRRIHATMQELVEEGIADGSIAPCYAKFAALTLASALNGPSRWHSPDGPQSPPEIAVALVNFLTAGLAPR